MVILILLTLIWLGLIFPAGMITIASLMSVANIGAGTGLVETWRLWVGYTWIISSGSFPVVAVLVVIAAWVLRSQDQAGTAQVVILLPLINIVIFLVCSVLFFRR